MPTEPASEACLESRASGRLPPDRQSLVWRPPATHPHRLVASRPIRHAEVGSGDLLARSTKSPPSPLRLMRWRRPALPLYGTLVQVYGLSTNGIAAPSSSTPTFVAATFARTPSRRQPAAARGRKAPGLVGEPQKLRRGFAAVATQPGRPSTWARAILGRSSVSRSRGSARIARPESWSTMPSRTAGALPPCPLPPATRPAQRTRACGRSDGPREAGVEFLLSAAGGADDVVLVGEAVFDEEGELIAG